MWSAPSEGARLAAVSAARRRSLCRGGIAGRRGRAAAGSAARRPAWVIGLAWAARSGTPAGARPAAGPPGWWRRADRPARWPARSAAYQATTARPRWMPVTPMTPSSSGPVKPSSSARWPPADSPQAATGRGRRRARRPVTAASGRRPSRRAAGRARWPRRRAGSRRWPPRSRLRRAVERVGCRRRRAGRVPAAQPPAAAVQEQHRRHRSGAGGQPQVQLQRPGAGQRGVGHAGGTRTPPAASCGRSGGLERGGPAVGAIILAPPVVGQEPIRCRWRRPASGGSRG